MVAGKEKKIVKDYCFRILEDKYVSHFFICVKSNPTRPLGRKALVKEKAGRAPSFLEDPAQGRTSQSSFSVVVSDPAQAR